jgi:hemerythrin-like domain-containing protein
MPESSNRREFLLRTGMVCGIGIGPVLASVPLFGEEKKQEKGDEGISPAEDLMREHGVLNRILLIYEEHLRRLDAKQDFDPQVLSAAAGIVRKFVEDYHEKLEQDFLFPRFRKAGKLVQLVDTLYAQHQAGRTLTARIQQLAVASTVKDDNQRRQLVDALHAFLRMYRPHEAREDTVLFPAFRKIVSPHEYDALGDDFEKKEDELFGEEGFFKVVDDVSQFEKKLGIYELAQFTPKL